MPEVGQEVDGKTVIDSSSPLKLANELSSRGISFGVLVRLSTAPGTYVRLPHLFLLSSTKSQNGLRKVLELVICREKCRSGVSFDSLLEIMPAQLHSVFSYNKNSRNELKPYLVMQAKPECLLEEFLTLSM